MTAPKRFRPTPCPDCGVKPGLWEVTFFGYRSPKFKVECPECKKKTNFYDTASSAASAWERGTYMSPREDRENFDNDSITELMGKIMEEINKDYQRIASGHTPSRWESTHIKELEEFVIENPYMLPYDREYVVEEMRRQAEKTRKKQAS